jgi:hypothetical protein
MALFIVLPSAGFIIGYNYGLSQKVEVFKRINNTYQHYPKDTTFETKETPFSITYNVTTPFSSSAIQIRPDGTLFYYSIVEMVEDSAESKLTTTQMVSLYNLVEEVKFITMEDRPYENGNPLDGSQYSITFTEHLTTDSTDTPLTEAYTHTVSCYEFNCEEDFIKLRDAITGSWEGAV